ncbi:hypothetical protein [Actinotalea subterranea]|uniref:hypothetical protein n=1 Tax=Actinotalea subterranea TaxID=2607497 RepID=UPI0011EDEACF|nr:hypothetical protein [Actinotalea subterranea]
MNTLDDAASTTLRRLDPADRQVHPGARAAADLEAILSSPLGSPCPPAARARGRTGRRRPGVPARRLVVVGGLAAAAALGLVLLEPLAGGDPAFATWTGVPSGLSATEEAAAVVECRDSSAEAAQGDDPFADRLASGLRTATPVVVERRGAWTTVVLAGADGFSALCITDDSAPPFAGAMIGALGTPDGFVEPQPREVRASSLGMGATGGGEVSVAVGVAGSDVVAVVYRSRVHGDVSATVNHGHFALWLPGDELTDASSQGVDVEVTYRDGATATARLTL